jgi:hypothetical protein
MNPRRSSSGFVPEHGLPIALVDSTTGNCLSLAQSQKSWAMTIVPSCPRVLLEFMEQD